MTRTAVYNNSTFYFGDPKTLARRLERETGRNVELIWLLGRLAPDFKTIANFRRHNGKAIRKVCAQFVGLCLAGSV